MSCEIEILSHQDLVEKIMETIFSEPQVSKYLQNNLKSKLAGGDDLPTAAKDVIDRAFESFDLMKTLTLLKDKYQKRSRSVDDLLSMDRFIPSFSLEEPELPRSLSKVKELPEIPIQRPVKASSNVCEISTDSTVDNRATHGKHMSNDIIYETSLDEIPKSTYHMISPHNCTSPLSPSSSSSASSSSSSSYSNSTTSSKRVQFKETIITDTFIIREKFSREEVETLFYSPFEGFRFSNEFEEENIRAESEGMTWSEWIELRTDEDIEKEHQEQEEKKKLFQNSYKRHNTHFDMDESNINYREYEIEESTCMYEDESFEPLIDECENEHDNDELDIKNAKSTTNQSNLLKKTNNNPQNPINTNNTSMNKQEVSIVDDGDHDDDDKNEDDDELDVKNTKSNGKYVQNTAIHNQNSSKPPLMIPITNITATNTNTNSNSNRISDKENKKVNNISKVNTTSSTYASSISGNISESNIYETYKQAIETINDTESYLYNDNDGNTGMPLDTETSRHITNKETYQSEEGVVEDDYSVVYDDEFL